MTSLVDLIPALLQKTKEGRLEWEDISGGSFVARLGENSVETSYDRDGDPKISLLDSNGRKLDTVLWGNIGSPFDDQLSELTAIARRRALRIDDTLKSVKGFLDNL
jgi:hypothetical protein